MRNSLAIVNQLPNPLQARADALMMKTATPLPSLQNVVPTLALV